MFKNKTSLDSTHCNLMFILFFILFSVMGPSFCFSQTDSVSSSYSFLLGQTPLPNQDSDPLNTDTISQKNKDTQKTKNVSDHTLTGTIAFLSDYRSRGISQTLLQPCVQGEIKYTHSKGYYFKSWASNVDGTGNFITNTSMEWDFFIGFKNKLLKTDIEYDVGFLFYYYPGGKPKIQAHVTYNTIEYYLSFNYKGLQLKISQTLTNYFGINNKNPPTNWNTRRPISPNGDSYGSIYLEMNYSWEFVPKWTLAFHAGSQHVVHYPQLSYLDGQITLIREFDWFVVSLFYVNTNAKLTYYRVPDDGFKSHRKYLGGSELVLGIAKTF